MATSRGSVHVFRGVYTEPDPANPGQRRTVLTKRYYWRFYYHGRLHSGGPGQTTKGAAMQLRRGELVVAFCETAAHGGDPPKTPPAPSRALRGRGVWR